MIYCCQEHVELALDVVVDEFETFPKIDQLSEEKKLSTNCEYCQNRAEYVVAN
ncbi:CxxH/CxxC protein (TIGR04129 family) [Bacillus ectoiniformans]|uniref:CxxH/CxxC protein n=1 Tax=Bacillus ectoiniformans TaxID=1494429 RepID=UPI0019574C73|nr:CxxH/CxxC protein [Bacillus ectoiniformans]MBM7648167.1 CxxH/CxxC protein (TIGR04129 family) [Bacillus ectoiniformans]